MKPVALLDACILYPPSLRDMLMWLATEGVFEARLTENIHAEWIRNVLADNPDVSPTQLERTRRLMNQAIPGCVVSNYESIIPTLLLPDANDQHVLAAAIKAQANFIVTFNLADFPGDALQPFGMKAVHPDTFLSNLFDGQPELFLRAVRKHRASLHNPPKDAEGYLETLKANRLPELASRLNGFKAAF